MRTFIEVRNEQLKSERGVNERNEETWQKAAARGEHEAWIDVARRLVAYYNSKTEYCDVSEQTARSADGKVMVLDADYYALPGSLYVLAE